MALVSSNSTQKTILKETSVYLAILDGVPFECSFIILSIQHDVFLVSGESVLSLFKESCMAWE